MFNELLNYSEDQILEAWRDAIDHIVSCQSIYNQAIENWLDALDEYMWDRFGNPEGDNELT